LLLVDAARRAEKPVSLHYADGHTSTTEGRVGNRGRRERAREGGWQRAGGRAGGAKQGARARELEG